MVLLYGFAAAYAASLVILISIARVTGNSSGKADAFTLIRNSHASPGGDLFDLDNMDAAEISRSARTLVYREQRMKRAIDVSASIFLLFISAPLLLLAAIAIKLDSAGPVIYRQQRVGCRGELFEVYKLRSMYVDAEQNGPQYASVGDDRITRVGKLIRKTRIDEIPQAINVLRGEMSFVGPRPERPEFVDVLELAIPHYHARHLVKPGITGWAQVKYEYAATVEGAREKLKYDLYYIRRYSPLLDLRIIAMTARVVFFGLGSR